MAETTVSQIPSHSLYIECILYNVNLLKQNKKTCEPNVGEKPESGQPPTANISAMHLTRISQGRFLKLTCCTVPIWN